VKEDLSDHEAEDYAEVSPIPKGLDLKFLLGMLDPFTPDPEIFFMIPELSVANPGCYIPDPNIFPSRIRIPDPTYIE
jgi:hypothetical protein